MISKSFDGLRSPLAHLDQVFVSAAHTQFVGPELNAQY